jgi:hypothetical protein
LPSAIHGERFLEDTRRRLGKMKSGEFFLAREGDIGYIASGAGLSGKAFAKIIHNHEVKSRPLFRIRGGWPIIQENPVEHFNQIENTNFDSRFFPQLASDAITQTFAKLQRSTRD